MRTFNISAALAAVYLLALVAMHQGQPAGQYDCKPGTVRDNGTCLMSDAVYTARTWYLP